MSEKGQLLKTHNRYRQEATPCGEGCRRAPRVRDHANHERHADNDARSHRGRKRCWISQQVDARGEDSHSGRRHFEHEAPRPRATRGALSIEGVCFPQTQPRKGRRQTNCTQVAGHQKPPGHPLLKVTQGAHSDSLARISAPKSLGLSSRRLV